MKNRIRKGDKCCTLLERCQNTTDSRCTALKMLERLIRQMNADTFDAEDSQKMCGG